MTGGWRKLHNEELHNLYSPFNIVQLTKTRRIIGILYAVHMGIQKCIQKFDQKTHKEETILET
jgi:hypothetical protein